MSSSAIMSVDILTSVPPSVNTPENKIVIDSSSEICIKSNNFESFSISDLLENIKILIKHILAYSREKSRVKIDSKRVICQAKMKTKTKASSQSEEGGIWDSFWAWEAQFKEAFFRKRKLLSGMILGLVLVAGLLLRLGFAPANLAANPASEPFVSILQERTFWYDEAFTGILLKASWKEMNQMIYDDVHPPLYYWLAKPWSAAFDYSPVGIRSFSLLFGMLTIVSLFWIGSRLFGPKAGRLAAALAAFSPFAVQYSQEARMYALLGFLFLWASWFFYRALDKNRLQDWLIWGVLGGLCFYTHYLSLFFFVSFYIAFYFYQVLFLQGGYFWSLWGQKRPLFWLGVAIIGGFFASWLKVFWVHFTKTDGDLGWIAPSNLSDLPGTLQIFLFGHPPGAGGTPDANPLKFFFDQSSVGLLVLVAMAVLIFCAWIKKRRRPEILVLGTISLGALLLLIIISHFDIKFYVARYMMPAAVIFYLLLSGLIVSATRWRPGLKAVIFLVAYLALLSTLQPIDYARGWARLYQVDQEVDYLKSRILIANGPFEYTSARYYFGQERVRFFSPGNLGEDFSGWVVVGNHNRLSSKEELRASPNFTIVDRQCEWEELNLEGYSMNMKRYGEMRLCVPGTSKF